jgi:hypothetical protein
LGIPKYDQCIDKNKGSGDKNEDKKQERSDTPNLGWSQKHGVVSNKLVHKQVLQLLVDPQTYDFRVHGDFFEVSAGAKHDFPEFLHDLLIFLLLKAVYHQQLTTGWALKAMDVSPPET